MSFHKVAILGGGLLGGSLALAAPVPCSLWGRRAATVEAARAAGVLAATLDLAEAVDGADLVVLAVPVGAMAEILERAIAAGLGAGAVVTDVGSVKGPVHAQLEPMAAAAGLHWIGGHPMAGSERQGFEAARADLFDGAWCLLTAGVAEPGAAGERLQTFWERTGCRVRWMTPTEHDALVARISHLPHVLSAATAMVAMESPEDARFSGGGLRDTARVAAGDPAMWAEILHENRRALIAPLRRAVDELAEVAEWLEKDDPGALFRWLESARERHKEASERRDAC